MKEIRGPEFFKYSKHRKNWKKKLRYRQNPVEPTALRKKMSCWRTHYTRNMREQKMQVIHAPLTQSSRAGCSISTQKDPLFPRMKKAKALYRIN